MIGAVRLAVTICAAVLLAGGYVASQWAFFMGDPAAYVQRLDESPVPMISLAILIAAIVLCFVPDKAESGAVE